MKLTGCSPRCSKYLIGMLVLAQAFTTFGIVWPQLIQTPLYLSPDWNDALRGVMFGISIGVNLAVLMTVCRKRVRARQ